MPTVRIAAMSDVHVSKTSHGTLAPILAQVADRADVLLLCGDLTDYGTAEEARVLVKELGTLRLPTIAVLGNHDYESGTPEAVADALRDVGVAVLDGDSHEVHGIGFAGVKGFCGGFGRGTLGSWGEPMVKTFVKEALDETLKLETALARLRTPQKVAVLHYSPVRDTVEGEPLEIFPFLGCGRHEEPLVRYKVAAAFHGHAHNGHPEGRLGHGAPVYNVALPLLRKRAPGELPVKFLELDPEGSTADGHPYDGMERRRGATPPAASPAAPAGANGAR
jgi:Icc-related predicted phosphoesterase